MPGMRLACKRLSIFGIIILLADIIAKRIPGMQRNSRPPPVRAGRPRSRFCVNGYIPGIRQILYFLKMKKTAPISKAKPIR